MVWLFYIFFCFTNLNLICHEKTIGNLWYWTAGRNMNVLLTMLWQQKILNWISTIVGCEPQYPFSIENTCKWMIFSDYFLCMIDNIFSFLTMFSLLPGKDVNTPFLQPGMWCNNWSYHKFLKSLRRSNTRHDWQSCWQNKREDCMNQLYRPLILNNQLIQQNIFTLDN